MSPSLQRRIARLEESCEASGDWRQFGNDPRDMPDWALNMALREEIEERLKLAEERQLSSQTVADARAAVEAEIDRAIQLILQLAGSDMGQAKTHRCHLTGFTESDEHGVPASGIIVPH
jgi:hypothetical protein